MIVIDHTSSSIISVNFVCYRCMLKLDNNFNHFLYSYHVLCLLPLTSVSPISFSSVRITDGAEVLLSCLFITADAMSAALTSRKSMIFLVEFIPRKSLAPCSFDSAASSPPPLPLFIFSTCPPPLLLTLLPAPQLPSL